MKYFTMCKLNLRIFQEKESLKRILVACGTKVNTDLKLSKLIT